MKVSKKVRKSFCDKILSLLEPMGGVIAIESEEEIRFYKNDIIFGSIVNNIVYLTISDDRQVQISKKTLKEPDEFLKKATKAYWIASRM